MDSRVLKMADVLVRYSADVHPGDWVIIQTSPLGEPLGVACVEAVLRAGGHPSLLLESEEAAGVILREGSQEQLEFVSPLRELMVERMDAVIRISAPANTRALGDIDPARIAAQRRADTATQSIYNQRAATGSLRWVGTQFPTQAGAQDADMSLREYEDFLFGACFLNEANPIAAWKDLYRRQQRLVDWLSDKSTVHITGPDTDLTLSIAGRTWINSDGHRNFPSGEVFTGPVETATEGRIRFSYPAYMRGREVTGVCLEFKDGKVVNASADSGEDFLLQMLDMDEGARFLGEFAFGTNYGIRRFTRNTLFDEKIGGTIHMALGRAYPESGSHNVSALHWDMVYDLRTGGEVTVDGTTFSKNGQFQVWVPLWDS